MSVQHMMVMEDMLKDFLLGEHLLLVGNQVGNTWSSLSLLLCLKHHSLWGKDLRGLVLICLDSVNFKRSNP